MVEGLLVLVRLFGGAITLMGDEMHVHVSAMELHVLHLRCWEALVIRGAGGLVLRLLMTLVISASDDEKTRELVGTSAGAIKGAAPGLRPLAKALTGLRDSAVVCEDNGALLATALVLSVIVRSTQGVGAQVVSLPGAEVRFFC